MCILVGNCPITERYRVHWDRAMVLLYILDSRDILWQHTTQMGGVPQVPPPIDETLTTRATASCPIKPSHLCIYTSQTTRSYHLTLVP